MEKILETLSAIKWHKTKIAWFLFWVFTVLNIFQWEFASPVEIEKLIVDISTHIETIVTGLFFFIWISKKLYDGQIEKVDVIQVEEESEAIDSLSELAEIIKEPEEVSIESYFQQYLKDTLALKQPIEFDWAYFNQCVDVVKHYMFYVHRIPNRSFGWSAKTAWENVVNTFPVAQWERVVNDYNDMYQVPNEWDIIFFEGSAFDPVNWHVAIVVNAEKWSNAVTVFEQNAKGSWTWKGEDAPRIFDYNYSGVSGWYKKINS